MSMRRDRDRSHGHHGKHKVRSGEDGLLGHEPQSSNSLLTMGKASFEGFVNLAFVFLVVATGHLIVFNYQDKGFLVDLTLFKQLTGDLPPAIVFGAVETVLSPLLYVIVRRAADSRISWTIALLLHIAEQLVHASLTFAFAYFWAPAPLVSTMLGSSALVLALKRHSYFMTNRRLAQLVQRMQAQTVESKTALDQKPATQADTATTGEVRSRKGSGPEVTAAGRDEEDSAQAKHYPSNLTYSNFVYFIFSPTLCYEPVYPRTDRIRWLYVFKELAAFNMCLLIIYVLGLQYLAPAFRAVARPEELHVAVAALEISVIAIPCMCIWLLGFYAFFHCFLNALSEVLRFADRRFYMDFWNATNLADFWREWNKPVHEWLLRHVYLESIASAKLSRTQATFAVFLVSAIGHEVVLSLSFRMLQPWFFLAMIVQAPLMLLSHYLSHKGHGHRWGNIIVWVSLFIGQPLIETLYMREWFRRYVF